MSEVTSDRVLTEQEFGNWTKITKMAKDWLEKGDIKWEVDRARVRKSTKMGKYLYERGDIR